HAQHDVLTGRAELVGASPVLAPARFVPARIAEVDQGVEVAVADGVDAAATPAVPAVRAAEGNELLPAKADTAVPAVAGDDFDTGFVDELHGWIPRPAAAMLEPV